MPGGFFVFASKPQEASESIWFYSDDLFVLGERIAEGERILCEEAPMFCDRCGTALQMGQGFCSQCGKGVTQGMRIAYPRPNRVREHVRLLGILWLALSALNAVGGAMLFVIANTFLRHHAPGMELPGGPRMYLQPFLSFLGIMILLRSLLGFVAGWGLLQRESWARVLTLVLAFLSLFSIPFGTALGIYSLWVLLPCESDREYEEQARAA